MSQGNNPHLLLGRIRFLNRCIECFEKSQPVPECLCYVPKEVHYKICKDSPAVSHRKTPVPVFEHPQQTSNFKKLWKYNIEPKKGTCVRTTGEEYRNSQGLWVKILKEQMEEHLPGIELEEGWILVCTHTEGGDRLVPVESPETVSRQQQLLGHDHKPCNSWEQVVNVENAFYIGSKPKIAESDDAAIQKLRYVPSTWTNECDEDLVLYVYDHVGEEDENLGCLKRCVNSIDVSTFNCDPREDAKFLTDGNTENYWESCGLAGQHWIRLNMKRDTVIKKLMLTVDATDSEYMPKKVSIFGGKRHNLRKLRDVTIDESWTGDICVLEDMTSHQPVIEIRIEECKDNGENVRIRGLKIELLKERDLGLNADIFQSSYLVRYPRLQGYMPDVLYRRALVIQRFISLLDSVLLHLVPAFGYSLGTFDQIKSIKQFLLLSKRRSALVTQCLKASEKTKPNFMPRLYINRRLAMEHREDPSLDPSCKNAVFNQVYEGLKPTDKSDKILDYRWPSWYEQWWECKFIGENVDDQGGGFRDSLTDISEELCPSSAECPVPLPFFSRTSNQDSSEARDYYVPNPSCKEFHKYEWIGQIMGAALRGNNFLVLALPGLVWKQLIGEAVSWNKDFPAVDSVLVNLLKAMENMDRETFEFRFGEELVYTTLLSDGQMLELIPGGSNVAVRYEDRSEFVRLVQKARLEESKQQIAAIRAGLLKVVPQAVLDLLTWQEVEKKVCGDPEVTVENLKRFTLFVVPEPGPQQYFWEALTNFTNEDRSRFLKFVTGRSRLPAPIYIYNARPINETVDELPQSSTCSNTLHLPIYTSAKVCEEKLRYAAYNCVAIDTDMSAWEE